MQFRPDILPLVILLLFAGKAVTSSAQNDIVNVEVETYYISDLNDETDTDGGSPLPAGSKTYRVFLHLVEGSKLRSIYGDVNHEIRIESTAKFFNNQDRGQTFGHLIQNNRLSDNTVALDSWLSFGAGSNARYGVLKSEDPDGSGVGGANNDGGSENIPGGLLANEDPEAGIPLTVQDGLILGTNLTPANFIVTGDSPETIFGVTTADSSFRTNNFRLLSAAGVQGPTAANKLLIAQLTTLGPLSFELNIEVINPQGQVFKYVAQNGVAGSGETVSAFLTYPPQCGCTDPDYLEYNAVAGCDDGSCTTLVQLGCADTAACNYDPNANFNIPGLCCYSVDNCNGLDVSIICPALSVGEEAPSENFRVYPNPFDDRFTLSLNWPQSGAGEISIYDVLGKRVMVKKVIGNSNGLHDEIDLSSLACGTYILHLTFESMQVNTRIVKK